MLTPISAVYSEDQQLCWLISIHNQKGYIGYKGQNI